MFLMQIKFCGGEEAEDPNVGQESKLEVVKAIEWRGFYSSFLYAVPLVDA